MHVPLGIMIAHPSPAVHAGQLAKMADFFWVGTNDLVQYVQATDRGNPERAGRVDGLHPDGMRVSNASVSSSPPAPIHTSGLEQTRDESCAETDVCAQVAAGDR